MDTFPQWINRKFVEWQAAQGKRKTVEEFAIYLGISRRIAEIDQKTKTAVEQSTAAEMRNAKRNQVMNLLLSQLSQQAQHLPHWLQHANPSEVNTVLHALFEKIILHGDTIELVFWE